MANIFFRSSSYLHEVEKPLFSLCNWVGASTANRAAKNSAHNSSLTLGIRLIRTLAKTLAPPLFKVLFRVEEGNLSLSSPDWKGPECFQRTKNLHEIFTRHKKLSCWSVPVQGAPLLLRTFPDTHRCHCWKWDQLLLPPAPALAKLFLSFVAVC